MHFIGPSCCGGAFLIGRAILTSDAIKRGLPAVSRLVTQYLHSKEPIELPAGEESLGFTVEQLTLLNSTHSSVTFVLQPGKGVVFGLQGFGAALKWKIKDFLGDSHEAVSTISKCSVLLSLQLSFI